MIYFKVCFKTLTNLIDRFANSKSPGSLDRVAHGLVADDILTAADEIVGVSQQIFNDAYQPQPSPTAVGGVVTSTGGGGATLYSPQVANSAQPTQASVTLAGSTYSPSGQQQQTPTNPVAFSTPMIVSNKSISNQTIALSHILQKRSFSNASKAALFKLQNAKDDPRKSELF